ncbi:MAG: NifB/NifX family molybdenum-iron cluster-binding protein [Promethearchaeota archaeon]
MIESIKIAIGVGENDEIFAKGHFGESKKYFIYKYSMKNNKIELLKTISNTSPEERMHGDPDKAKNVASIIGDVDCIFAHALGQNIKRMKKKYLILISRSFNIKEALNKLSENMDLVLHEFIKNSEERKVIHI